MQQSEVFWKLSENLQGNVCDRDHFSKALVLQNGLKYGIIFIISDSSKIFQTVCFQYTKLVALAYIIFHNYYIIYIIIMSWLLYHNYYYLRLFGKRQCQSFQISYEQLFFKKISTFLVTLFRVGFLSAASLTVVS